MKSSDQNARVCGRLKVITVAAVMAVAVATTQGQPIKLDKMGWTVLHKQAEKGNVEKVIALVFGGHDVDEQVSVKGELERLKRERAQLDPALLEAMERWLAFRRKKDETLEEWWARMDDPRREEEQRRRSKELAESIVKFTREYVDLFMIQMYEGATALHIASGSGHVEVVKALLDGERVEVRANVKAKTEVGMQPLDFAAINNHKYVIRVLIENGASEQTRSRGGFSALHWAAMANAVQAARELLKHKALVNAVTDDGITAMDLALMQKEEGYLLRELLKQHGGQCAKKCLGMPTN